MIETETSPAATQAHGPPDDHQLNRCELFALREIRLLGAEALVALYGGIIAARIEANGHIEQVPGIDGGRFALTQRGKEYLLKADLAGW